MIDNVFDRFVQQPKTIDRSRGGLGLGLTIVRSLVELHGGTISVHSEGAGKGSAFTVELPKAELAPRFTAPVATPSESPERAPGMRILVVEDNEDAATTLKDVLENLGCTVEIAFDGPSALRTARTFRPVIALVDIGLPLMDGYELAQHLREQGPPAFSSWR